MAVDENSVYGSTIFLVSNKFECVLGICCDPRLASPMSQPNLQVSYRLVASIDDERFRSTSSRKRGNQTLERSAVCCWEMYPKFGSFLFCAIDSNGAAHVFDDAFANRESETSPSILASRGSVCLGKGLEEFVLRVFG